VLEQSVLVREETGRPVRLVGIVMDVTERKRAETLQAATFRIAQAALAAPTLQELLPAIHAIIQELMPAANFYVALYDEANRMIRFPYFVDAVDHAFAAKPLGKGLTEFVIRTGQPLLATSGVYREMERRGEVELVGAPSLDWVGVPLKLGDKTIGVLAAQTYTEGVRYGERERDILQFVSTQVAQAIERKHAEDQLKESEAKYRVLFESNPKPCGSTTTRRSAFSPSTTPPWTATAGPGTSSSGCRSATSAPRPSRARSRRRSPGGDCAIAARTAA